MLYNRIDKRFQTITVALGRAVKRPLRLLTAYCLLLTAYWSST